jgi:hypothetical protein
MQEWASVTVTQYVPAVSPVAVWVFCIGMVDQVKE